MIARARRHYRPIVEALEERQLLSFDAGIAGAIEHEDYTRVATSGMDSFYLENRRIGYSAANLDSILVNTSMSPADPQQYVGGSRFLFKPAGTNPYRIGTVTLRNSEARNIQAVYYWDKSLGRFTNVHTDGVWFANLVSEDAANTSIFVLDNVSAQEIEGREAFHYEGGSARRIYFRNTYAHNETTYGGARYSIKINPGQVIRELIFENADLNATGTQHQIDQLVFAWQSGTDPRNAATYLPRIWVKNDGQAAITRDYVIGQLKASGVPDAVARDIVRDGLPEDLNHQRAPIDIGVTRRIEAEDFDYGREGMAYHDTSLADENGGDLEYRDDVPANDDLAKVDIRQTNDIGGGHEVTAVRAGEWMTYTIRVPSSGIYRVDARVQAGLGGGSGTFAIEFDGLATTGQMAVPAGGAWSTQSASVFLSAGVHVMRVAAKTADNSGWNLNWIELAKTGDAVAAWPTGLSAVAEPWGLIRRDGGGPRVAEAWGGQIKLSWSDTPGEDAYVIERSANGMDGWVQVGRNAAGQTTFSDTGVKGLASLKIDQGIQPESVYYYRIRALSAAGDRVSDILRVTTPKIVYTAAPSVPAQLSAELYPVSMASGAVQLTWQNTCETARGFYVERRMVGNTTFARFAPVEAAPGVNTFVDTDTALTAGTSYEYRVIAYNWLGESAPSNIAQVSVPADIGPVAAPTGFSAVALGNGSAKLTWTDNSDNEAAFEIRRPGDGTLVAVVPARAGTGQIVTASLTGLTIPNTYSFFVRAVNIDYQADSTSTGSVFVAGQPTPGVGVTDLTAFAVGDGGSRGIELWWPAAGDEIANDVAAYKIERSVDGTAWIEIGTVAAGNKAQYSYKDAGLAGSTRYYYRVRTYNRSGGASAGALSTVLQAATNSFNGFLGSSATDQVIQAEDFDRGGEGTGYHGISNGNSGGFVYRTKPDGSGSWIADPFDGGVDIATDGSDVFVTDAQAGEWLQYTMTSPRSGMYKLLIRARLGAGGTFHVKIDGIDRTGPLNGNGSGTWQILAIPNIVLHSGEHVIRLVMEGNGAGGQVGDFDWMQLVEQVGLYTETGSVVIHEGADVLIASGAGQMILVGEALGADKLGLCRDQFGAIELNGGRAKFTVDLGSITAAQTAVEVNGGKATFAATQHLASLSISRMGEVVLESGGNKVLVTDALSIAKDGLGIYQGRLDLMNNSMLIRSDSQRRLKVLSAVGSMIRSGMSSGTRRWMGAGLGSSIAAISELKGLGAMLDADGSSVRVKFTWYGDTNLDGVVDQRDYTRIDTGFIARRHGYENGDFNYDGGIDAADYFQIDAAFVVSGGSPAVTGQAAPIKAAILVMNAPSSSTPWNWGIRREDLESLLA